MAAVQVGRRLGSLDLWSTLDATSPRGRHAGGSTRRSRSSSKPIGLADRLADRPVRPPIEPNARRLRNRRRRGSNPATPVLIRHDRVDRTTRHGSSPAVGVAAGGGVGPMARSAGHGSTLDRWRRSSTSKGEALQAPCFTRSARCRTAIRASPAAACRCHQRCPRRSARSRPRPRCRVRAATRPRHRRERRGPVQSARGGLVPGLVDPAAVAAIPDRLRLRAIRCE